MSIFVAVLEKKSLITACFYDVFSVALHPEKQILATASDDRTWKLWSLPNCELIMTGHGHTDWIAGCDFHPSYVHLSTWCIILLVLFLVASWAYR